MNGRCGLAVVLGALSGFLISGCQSDVRVAERAERPLVTDPLSDFEFVEVYVSRDTYLSGAEPHSNFRSEATLFAATKGKKVALLGFDADRIEAALAGREPISVFLQVTAFSAIPNRTSRSEAILEVHETVRAWDDALSTYKCAREENLNNDTLDCDRADRWTLTGKSGLMQKEAMAVASAPARLTRQDIIFELTDLYLPARASGVAPLDFAVASSKGKTAGTFALASLGTGYDARLVFEVPKVNSPLKPLSVTQAEGLTCPSATLNRAMNGGQQSGIAIMAEAPMEPHYPHIDNMLLAYGLGEDMSRGSLVIRPNPNPSFLSGTVVFIGNLSTTDDMIIPPGDCVLTHDGGQETVLNNAAPIVVPDSGGLSVGNYRAFWIAEDGALYYYHSIVGGVQGDLTRFDLATGMDNY